MSVTSLKYKTKLGTLAAPGDVDPGAMIPIATTLLATTASTITFSNITREYEHLQIRLLGVSGATYSEIAFNSDFGANYSWHQLTTDGTSITVGGGASANQIYAAQLGASTSVPSITIIDILDYANTAKNKTVKVLNALDANGSGFIYFRSGAWMNTNAISTIRLQAQAGTGTFASGTQAALYGIKRAGA